MDLVVKTRLTRSRPDPPKSGNIVTRPDPTRPDPTRPDPTRPDPTRGSIRPVNISELAFMHRRRRYRHRRLRRRRRRRRRVVVVVVVVVIVIILNIDYIMNISIPCNLVYTLTQPYTVYHYVSIWHIIMFWDQFNVFHSEFSCGRRLGRYLQDVFNRQTSQGYGRHHIQQNHRYVEEQKIIYYYTIIDYILYGQLMVPYGTIWNPLPYGKGFEKMWKYNIDNLFWYVLTTKFIKR